MHVTDREGHMIEAALGLGRLEQEEIVVAAARRAAQEMAAPGIAVGQTKTERLIEGGGLGQRIGEEDDVSDFDRPARRRWAAGWSIRAAWPQTLAGVPDASTARLRVTRKPRRRSVWVGAGKTPSRSCKSGWRDEAPAASRSASPVTPQITSRRVGPASVGARQRRIVRLANSPPRSRWVFEVEAGVSSRRTRRDQSRKKRFCTPRYPRRH
jgi:hypothetical protein